MAEWIRGTFNTEGSAYDGWYDPNEDWNGFACPVFDYKTSVQILNDLITDDASDFVDWEYDSSSSAFILYQDGRYTGEECEFEYPIVGTVDLEDGGESEVYGIGAGQWCWVAVG